MRHPYDWEDAACHEFSPHAIRLTRTTVLLTSKTLEFFTKFSDPTGAGHCWRCGSTYWPAALPPCNLHGSGYYQWIQAAAHLAFGGGLR